MMRAPQFQNAIGDWSAALPHPRMRVYRNNVAMALVNALKVRFPVTEQLVGAAFFHAMALEYADANRPSSPVLIEYGASLPDFIRGFAPAASVPYLAEVAELENLWWGAYHAREAPALAAGSLAALAPEELGDLRFELHPSVGLLQSSFAAASIWQAHHGGPSLDSIHVGAGECVVVARPRQDVNVLVIPAARLSFLSALKCGERLADAVERVSSIHPELDLGAELSGLFAAGFTTGYSI